MQKSGMLVATVTLLLVSVAGAVEAQRGPIGRMFVVQPKPGEAAAWEEAYKKHLDWHRSQNDKWNWTTYQIESGPRLGQYFIRTGGHEWADFDELGEMGSQDAADYFSNAGKHEASSVSWFDRTHFEMSRLPEGGGPYNILEYTRVVVKPAKVPEFMNAVAKFHAAFEKTDSPAVYAIAQVESGGRTSNFAFVGLHESWAGLEQDPMAIPKMMEEVYGRQDAQAIAEDFWSTVEEMETFTLRRRPDLSYEAGTSTSND